MAHSMGGLIIRAALSEISNGNPDFPPYLYVEDVVTLGTPHTGSRPAPLCGGIITEYVQCALMRPSSPWLASLNGNPQGAHGTDWTLFGAETDRVVSTEWTEDATGAAPVRAAVNSLHWHGTW